METSKIKSIDKTDNTWTGQSGTMYDYTVCMEDGTEGTAASPNPEKPPYDVGDEVEYAETTKRIGASWAIGLAIQQESDPEKIIEAAEHLINLRDALMSKL